MKLRGFCITDLPMEIQTLILLKLPAISIASMKCVSKSMYSLIKNPRFLAAHTQDPPSSPNLFSVQIDGLRNRDCDHVLISQNPTYVFSIKSLLQAVAKGDQVHIVGCDNGVFCALVLPKYVFEPCYIVLWNPFTMKECRVVGPHSGKEKWGDVFRAFAFVPDTNASKYVEIERYRHNVVVYDSGADSWTVIEGASCCLYELVSCDVEFNTYRGDRWSNELVSLHDVGMDVNPISRFVILDFGFPSCYSCQVRLNGAFHLLAHIPLPKDERLSFVAIVMFDLKDDKLKLFDVLGRHMFRHFHYGITLGVINESLALLSTECWGETRSSYKCSIWVMNDYGVHQSWTKLLSLREFPKFCVPIHYYKDDIWLLAEKLIRKPRIMISDLRNFLDPANIRLCLYNLSNRKVQRLPVHGYVKSLTVCSYTETLVLPRKGNTTAEEANT